jgi:hypothetical protein
MHQCINIFIIPYLKCSSTCFGRHTAHHQEPKTAQAASDFTYVEGCRTCSCWTLSGSVRLCSFRLLMMGGMSPETCWASFKIRNNKNFDTLLHLIGFFTVRTWFKLAIINPLVSVKFLPIFSQAFDAILSAYGFSRPYSCESQRHAFKVLLLLLE